MGKWVVSRFESWKFAGNGSDVPIHEIVFLVKLELQVDQYIRIICMSVGKTDLP